MKMHKRGPKSKPKSKPKPKCECMKKGVLVPGMATWYSPKELPYVEHEPGKCKCKNNLKEYWVDKEEGSTIWLCSNCTMSDEEVKKIKKTKKTKKRRAK